MWQRYWLYIRLTLLALIALLVVQMFLGNLGRNAEAIDPYDRAARTLLWTDRLGGVWALMVAFVLGLFATPLYRASIKALKEFKVDRARRKDEQAERAAKQSLSESRRPADQPKPDPSQTPSAADIWTSGENDVKK